MKRKFNLKACLVILWAFSPFVAILLRMLGVHRDKYLLLFGIFFLGAVIFVGWSIFDIVFEKREE